MQHRARILVALAFAVGSVPIAACGPGKNDRSAAGNVAPPSSMPPSGVPGTTYGPTNPLAPPTVRVDTAKATLKHHSKFKGALAGAAAGHMVGHGVAGAAAGAIYQHERNKHQK